MESTVAFVGATAAMPSSYNARKITTDQSQGRLRFKAQNRPAMSIVRENLMKQPGYTPYCGADKCAARWPRTRFNGSQFACSCGWRSDFEPTFIAEYVNRNREAAQSAE